MREIQASAPAKLILAGEYAVLRGGAAISAAVDVRAQATLRTATAKHELRSSNAELSFGFGFDARGHVLWDDEAAEHGALLAAAARVFAAQGPALAALAPFTIALDSRAFYTALAGAPPVKRGLGSSAAVAVVLTSCLQQALGQSPTLDTCLAVHHEFQAQRGSGIDVCTSFHGGVVAKSAGVITQPGWPADLLATPVWTCEPASTPAMLARLEAYRVRDGQQFAEHFERLRAAAALVHTAWTDSAVQTVLDALFGFAVVLREFDAAADIGIWSTPHNTLAQLAEDFGLVYKPSGAGGGDFGLVFGTDAERLDDFRLRAERQGFVLPELDLGARGLQLQVRD